MSRYPTWYEFKKALEKHAGHSLLNEDWFKVKPATPLPWHESSLRSSLLRLGRIENRKAIRRGTIPTGQN